MDPQPKNQRTHDHRKNSVVKKSVHKKYVQCHGKSYSNLGMSTKAASFELSLTVYLTNADCRIDKKYLGTGQRPSGIADYVFLGRPHSKDGRRFQALHLEMGK